MEYNLLPTFIFSHLFSHISFFFFFFNNECLCFKTLLFKNYVSHELRHNFASQCFKLKLIAPHETKCVCYTFHPRCEKKTSYKSV